jgi:hypothetical protein
LAARVEPKYRSVVRSIFGGVHEGELYALITSCSDAIAFLKSFETDLAIEVILIAIGVEPEYRSVYRSISRWGSKGDHNTPIAVESEMANLLRRLKST